MNYESQDTDQNNFRKLTMENQIISLFFTMRYVRNEIAVIHKELIEFTEDSKLYRTKREIAEEDTTEKIQRILGAKFNFGIWFRDKVLPSVITTIVIALLFLVFRSP